jgi:uncharacterized membrane protein
MEAKASTFFTKEQKERILEAIQTAENETSGEIRVHIETRFAGDVLDRAAWIFRKIGMHATEARNGVLFYLALDNRQFAVIGDSGINAVVPPDFWNKVKDILQKNFRAGQFTEGLVEGIIQAGNQLKAHFPRMKNDVNELPDDISFDDPDKPPVL